MPSAIDAAIPNISVRVNGAKLPAEAAADLLSVEVHESVAAASMFTLELSNWEEAYARPTWSDHRLFALGGAVEVLMGYGDRGERVMVGEITGIEPIFEADKLPTLIVRGYDARHRLLRGRKTRSFTNMTDSAIAAQVAGDAGIGARVENTQLMMEYVLQHNQTDLAFLQARAARLGYEVFVRDKLLFFRRPPFDASESSTLELGKDMIAFYPRLSSASQVSEVEVRGWDVGKKRPIVQRALAGQEGRMGDGVSGLSAARRAFGKAATADVSRPPLTAAEAAKIAQGMLNEAALAYVRAEGRCYGRPDVRAGTVTRIAGAGSAFSGRYYVTTASHRYRPTEGYRTSFTCQRNAS